MITTSRRIRRDWAPLTASVTVRNDTENSPITQVYDAEAALGERYNPDRSISPTVLRPVVRLSAPDGSLAEPLTNKDIGEMFWYANGEAIASDNSDYEIVTETSDDRGCLVIKRNVEPGERVELYFRCKVNDRRTAINHELVSDKIILSTVNKSEDEYSIAMVEDDRQTYNPIEDRLSLAEYKAAHGIKLATNELQNARLHESGYRRTVCFTVFRGRKPMTDGLAVELYRVNADGSLGTAITPDTNDEIEQVTPYSVTVDMRMAQSVNFAIVAKNTKLNRIVAVRMFSCRRHLPAVNVALKNDCGLRPDAENHYNEVLVSARGKSVDYPGAVFKTVWKTETAADGGVAVKRAEGSRAVIKLSDTGIGSTSADDWIDVSAEMDYRSFGIATDASGNVLTDGHGSDYIFS